MRVGVFTPGYLPESGGGYTFEQDLLQSLTEISRESSHEFVIFFENPKMHELQLPGNETLHAKVIIQSRLKSLLSRLLERITFQLGRKKKMAREVYYSLSDAIVQENIEFLWFLTPYHYLVDIPYIATIWDIQHRVQPWFPEVSAKIEWDGREKYLSQYIQRATYIITPNRVGRDEISFYYQISPERFLLLPHPAPKISVQETIQVDEVLEKYQLSRQGYLLYPAQFWPHKNHINLLRALKILRDNYKISIPLVLVGADKGNLNHVLASAKDMGIDGLLHVLGFVSKEDLISLYQGAFALTYLSLFGPENLPPLEAFICGCPVIVARVAGAEEQYGDAALLVDGTHPGEIAGEINALYTNPNLRERLIAKGCIRAEAFTAKEYVREVFTALDQFEAVRQNWGVEYNQNSDKVITSKK
jgi:glycosyltransferase involved in cell wall biosynthesis